MSAFGNSPLVLGGNSIAVPSGTSPVGTAGITDTQVAYGAATANTIKGIAAFTFTEATGLLKLGVSGSANSISITGDTNGAASIAAAGTNQSITLTPSGTGGTAGAVVIGNQGFIKGPSGTRFATLGSANANYLYSGGSGGLRVNNAADAATLLVITDGGNGLWGTTTDSSNGRIQLATHTTSAGGIGFGTEISLFRESAARLVLNTTSATGGQFELTANGATVWRLSNSSGAITQLSNGSFFLQSGGTTALTLDSSQFLLKSTGSNGQSLNIKHLTELTTIAAAATTDTTIQMPANAIVLSVSVRVTVVIPTATNFTVGDSGSATRFSTAAVSAAANSTDPGTKAGAYYNASALSVRITPDVQPADNTGRVRVTIAYLDVTVPTS